MMLRATTTTTTIQRNVVSSIDLIIQRAVQSLSVTLRAGQLEATRAIVQTETYNVLLVLPTGAGKTMCVQLAAQVACEKQQLLILVTPLVSLASDMCERLGRTALDGGTVNWSLPLIATLYVVRPEVLVSDVVTAALCRAHSERRLAGVVFDEATFLLASLFRSAVWKVRYWLAALRRHGPVKVIGMSGTFSTHQQRVFLAFTGATGPVRLVNVSQLVFKVAIDRHVYARRRYVDSKHAALLACEIVSNVQNDGGGGVCVVITRVVGDVKALHALIASLVFNNDASRIAIVIGAGNAVDTDSISLSRNIQLIVEKPAVYVGSSSLIVASTSQTFVASSRLDFSTRQLTTRRLVTWWTTISCRRNARLFVVV